MITTNSIYRGNVLDVNNVIIIPPEIIGWGEIRIVDNKDTKVLSKIEKALVELAELESAIEGRNVPQKTSGKANGVQESHHAAAHC
jgi:acetylornithine deacetylase/succinyl-diaminopimelate desuccinylase-like protein